ncbi:hypothetical protein [uncultured Tyzzerella sp.]|uniref:hypothetical protein n=1 Tax=uncultured Tyzzerella sp. TaxID=2321398 RepID=UPI002942BEA0|nr:hypothetical protein [uncultured Tyzzerella sp.]
MIKKITRILFSLLIISSLMGCFGKIEAIPMEAINIDFDVTTVDNGTVAFSYPSKDWEQKDSFNPEVIKILLAPKNENFQEGTNITVGITAQSTNVSLNDYVALMPRQLEKSSPGTRVNVAEIRKINDTEISYLEINTKMTEEDMKYGLENGIFSQENIEELGGKEAFLNQPETKQIQMSVSFEGRITNITGTYMKDEEKEAVLKVMTTMVQTATLK